MRCRSALVFALLAGVGYGGRAQVVADVGTVFGRYASACDLVERMEGRLLDRARRARGLTKLQYEKAAASLLEFLDAQRTYIVRSAPKITRLRCARS